MAVVSIFSFQKREIAFKKISFQVGFPTVTLSQLQQRFDALVKKKKKIAGRKWAHAVVYIYVSGVRK